MGKFDLEKEAEKVKFQLEKKNLANITAAVALVIDVSGSMQGRFQRGQVQDLVERVMPVALNFDDNGELDVFTFSKGDMIAKPSNATRKNYDGYVKKEILNNDKVPKWSGTDYAPVIRQALEEFGFYNTPAAAAKGGGILSIFKQSAPAAKPTLRAQSESGFPVIVFFVTDGASNDEADTTRLLQECETAKCNIYFNFIGINDDPREFRFLEKVADDFGNTGFFYVKNMEQMVSDDSVYDLLLPEELTEWLRAKKA